MTVTTTDACIVLLQEQIDYAGTPYEGCTIEDGKIFEAAKAQLIAEKFNVNAGRVSEVLSGKRV